MTKAASKGPKASIQYVRTLAKRLDRSVARGRETRHDIEELWEILYLLMSLMDPEMIDMAAKTVGFDLDVKPTQTLLVEFEEE